MCGSRIECADGIRAHRLTDQLLTNARTAADLAQTRYDLGLGTIVELSQAQLNATAARLRRRGLGMTIRLRLRCCVIKTGALK